MSIFFTKNRSNLQVPFYSKPGLLLILLCKPQKYRGKHAYGLENFDHNRNNNLLFDLINKILASFFTTASVLQII